MEASQNEVAAIARRGARGPTHIVPFSVQAVTHRHQSRQGKRLRVLFLGRIHPVKHLEATIDACAELRDGDGLAGLSVVGPGSERYVNTLRSLVVHHQLEPLTEFCGAKFRKDKAERLASADVLVLPSAVENFGLVVAEAAAAGLPVIVSDQVGVASDVLQHGAGLVVPAGDGPALAAALRDLQDPARRAELAAHGTKLAAERFSPASVAHALDHLYGV